MSNKKKPTNGGAKDLNKELEGVEIEFPVDFQLKVVIDSSHKDDETTKNIVSVLANLNIPEKYNGKRHSSKGTYTSYHYNVTLDSKKQMEDMYDELKKIPGFKFAL